MQKELERLAVKETQIALEKTLKMMPRGFKTLLAQHISWSGATLDLFKRDKYTGNNQKLAEDLQRAFGSLCSIWRKPSVEKPDLS